MLNNFPIKDRNHVKKLLADGKKTEAATHIVRIRKIVNAKSTAKRLMRSGYRNRVTGKIRKKNFNENRDIERVNYLSGGEVLTRYQKCDGRSGDVIGTEAYPDVDHARKQAKKFKGTGAGKFQRGRYAGGLDKRHYCPGKDDPSKLYDINKHSGRVRKRKEKNRKKIQAIHVNHCKQNRYASPEDPQVVRVCNLMMQNGGKSVLLSEWYRVFCDPRFEIQGEIEPVVKRAYAKLFQ